LGSSAAECQAHNHNGDFREWWKSYDNKLTANSCIALSQVQKRSDAGIYLTGTNSTQYAASFHDVTTGNNSALEFDSSNNPVSVTGFSAGTNWDATTGLGSPVGSSVVDYLIANVTPSDGQAAIATSKPKPHPRPIVRGHMKPN